MYDPLGALLFLLGVGFLVANVLALGAGIRYLRMRPTATLTWAVPKPRTYRLLVGMAVGLGVLVVCKLTVLRWPVWRVFGEAMMLAYYGLAYPLGLRVKRGFYRDGVWLERGFVPWSGIGGATWREDPSPTLVLIARARQAAWRLAVPGEHYAAARRLLRDCIAAHELHLGAGGLHLEGHDERDDV